MTLSRASWYAILAVIEVAVANKKDPDTPVLAKEIAAGTKVPPEYLAKLLTQLVKSKVLTSSRGPTGGYFMAAAPNELTLRDIVEVVDGRLDAGFPPKGRATSSQIHKSIANVLQKSIESLRGDLATHKLSKFI